MQSPYKTMENEDFQHMVRLKHVVTNKLSTECKRFFDERQMRPPYASLSAVGFGVSGAFELLKGGFAALSNTNARCFPLCLATCSIHM